MVCEVKNLGINYAGQVLNGLVNGEPAGVQTTGAYTFVDNSSKAYPADQDGSPNRVVSRSWLGTDEYLFIDNSGIPWIIKMEFDSSLFGYSAKVNVKLTLVKRFGQFLPQSETPVNYNVEFFNQDYVVNADLADCLFSSSNVGQFRFNEIEKPRGVSQAPNCKEWIVNVPVGNFGQFNISDRDEGYVPFYAKRDLGGIFKVSISGTVDTDDGSGLTGLITELKTAGDCSAKGTWTVLANSRGAWPQEYTDPFTNHFYSTGYRLTYSQLGNNIDMDYGPQGAISGSWWEGWTGTTHSITDDLPYYTVRGNVSFIYQGYYGDDGVIYYLTCDIQGTTSFGEPTFNTQYTKVKDRTKTDTGTNDYRTYEYASVDVTDYTLDTFDWKINGVSQLTSTLSSSKRYVRTGGSSGPQLEYSDTAGWGSHIDPCDVFSPSIHPIIHTACDNGSWPTCDPDSTCNFTFDDRSTSQNNQTYSISLEDDSFPRSLATSEPLTASLSIGTQTWNWDENETNKFFNGWFVRFVTDKIFYIESSGVPVLGTAYATDFFDHESTAAYQSSLYVAKDPRTGTMTSSATDDIGYL